ncbi:hypothetical protein QQG09_08210 [Melissococcus plutonius]|uniref:hypothetical protein n=1 Tax=Melissococcus plutonius TaxID=33970 RepID=UPI003EE78940
MLKNQRNMEKMEKRLTLNQQVKILLEEKRRKKCESERSKEKLGEQHKLEKLKTKLKLYINLSKKEGKIKRFIYASFAFSIINIEAIIISVFVFFVAMLLPFLFRLPILMPIISAVFFDIIFLLCFAFVVIGLMTTDKIILEKIKETKEELEIEIVLEEGKATEEKIKIDQAMINNE